MTIPDSIFEKISKARTNKGELVRFELPLFNLKTLFFSIYVLSMSSCLREPLTKEDVKKTIKNNPEIVISMIKNNPVKFIETLQIAAESSRGEILKARKQKKEERLNYYLSNPLEPNLRGDEAYRGDLDADIVVIVYSDFQCPFSRNAYFTVKELLQDYQGEILYVFKHLPLEFHSKAQLAAKYFEALRIKDPKLAMNLHDYIFENQGQLSRGEEFLVDAMDFLGVNKEEVEQIISKHPEVFERINADKEEAKRFNIEGTPGFIINGVAIRGAYPKETFVNVIEKVQSQESIQISGN